jgi:hypothetical protein
MSTVLSQTDHSEQAGGEDEADADHGAPPAPRGQHQNQSSYERYQQDHDDRSKDPIGVEENAAHAISIANSLRRFPCSTPNRRSGRPPSHMMALVVV